MHFIKNNRKEIKYIIPYFKALEIKKDISKLCKEDKHSTGGGYRIRSLYFDSINDNDYYTKINGDEIRKKIRLRTYGDNSIYKLELKQKYGDNQIKESLIISYETALNLCQGDYRELKKYFDKDIAVRMYCHLMAGVYRPKVLIDYTRCAFVYPLYNTRITFDTDVKSTESNFDLCDKNIIMNPVLNDRCILEIKYSGKMLGFISDLLSKYNLTQESYSKYISGRKEIIEVL